MRWTLPTALDLSNVDTIKTFAAAFNEKHTKLDILVNNAGLNTTGAYKGPTVTSQDYEICMGTNYFGHFMLTALLMPALMAADEARVVALSSVGERLPCGVNAPSRTHAHPQTRFALM